jgi:hypothetical protein
MRNPLEQAKRITDQLLGTEETRQGYGLIHPDVAKKIKTVRAMISKVHFKIQDIMDLTSLNRDVFKSREVFFNVKITILEIISVHEANALVKK